MIALSRACILGSHYGSYVPFIGTVTGTIDLLAKRVLEECGSLYLEYLQMRSPTRWVGGMVPFVGTVVLIQDDRKQEKILRSCNLEGSNPRPVLLRDLPKVVANLRTLFYLGHSKRMLRIVRNLQIARAPREIHGLRSQLQTLLEERNLEAVPAVLTRLGGHIIDPYHPEIEMQ